MYLKALRPKAYDDSAQSLGAANPKKMMRGIWYKDCLSRRDEICCCLMRFNFAAYHTLHSCHLQTVPESVWYFMTCF